MMKRLIIGLLAVLAMLALVGCELSKSTPAPEKKKTPKGAATGTSLVSDMDQEQLLRAYATQTALAVTQSGTQVLTAAEGTVLPETLVAQVSTAGAMGTVDPLASPALDLTAQPLVGTSEAGTSGVALQDIPSATPGPLPQTYTLQEGEFPFCIARRFNVSVNSLLSANGLGMNSMVSPGQSLKIPQGGPTYDGDRSLLDHPTTYMVKSGDTIYSIACDFGDVDPLYLAQVNNLQAPYTLSAGVTLQVP